MISPSERFQIPSGKTLLIEIGLLIRYRQADGSRAADSAGLEVQGEGLALLSRLRARKQSYGFWGPVTASLLDVLLKELSRFQEESELGSLRFPLPSLQARRSSSWSALLRAQTLSESSGKLLILSRLPGALFAAIDSGVGMGVLINQDRKQIGKSLERRLTNQVRKLNELKLSEQISWVETLGAIA